MRLKDQTITAALATVNVIAMLVALLAIFGWIIGSQAIKGSFLGGLPIRINGAIALALIAAAAPLGYVTVHPRAAVRNTALAFAALGGLIGLLTALESMLGTSFGIDEAIMRDLPLTGDPLTPGRMALSTALVVAGLAVATLLNIFRRVPAVAQAISLVTALTGYFVIVSYAFDSASLLGTSTVTRMAANTAVIVFSLSVATFFSQRRAFAGAVLSEAIGGLMARRLLPLCLLAPPLMGGLVVAGMNVGLLNPKLALSSMAVASVVVIMPIIIGLSWLMNRMGSDLTDEIRKQADLASELKILNGALPIGALFIDGQTLEPKNMNARARAILGEPLADSAPGTFSGLHRLLDRQGNEFPMERLPQTVALRDGHEAVEEIIGERPDGSLLTMKIRAVPVAGEQGRPIAAVVTIEDVTDVDAAQRQSLEFSSLVSHQLKSPLTSVRWTLEALIGSDYGQLNQEQQAAVRQALSSAERMTTVIRDILNSSRIESGLADTRAHWATAAEFLEAAVADTKPLALARRVTVSYRNSATRRVFLDVALMQQAVTNLLSNAIKYSPEAGTVDLKADEKGDIVIIEVADHGIGIPLADQDKVFSKFFRAGNAKQFAIEGTGLGLYICRNIVESAGGTLEFTSLPEHGTTFRMRLPLNGRHGGPSPDAA